MVDDVFPTVSQIIMPPQVNLTLFLSSRRPQWFPLPMLSRLQVLHLLLSHLLRLMLLPNQSSPSLLMQSHLLQCRSLSRRRSRWSKLKLRSTVSFPKKCQATWAACRYVIPLPIAMILILFNRRQWPYMYEFCGAYWIGCQRSSKKTARRNCQGFQHPICQ